MRAELSWEFLNLKNQYGDRFVPPEQTGLLPVTLMMVGESPAQTEMELHKPFVGYSGEILRASIRKHKFREMGITYYITNAVKIAHFDSEGHNINPSLDDIDKWRRMLHEEIVAYNPLAVLMLGGAACYAVTGDSPTIKSSPVLYYTRRRITHESLWAEPYLFLTYHPSSLHRDEEYKMRYESDLLTVAKFIWTSFQKHVENFTNES